MVSRTKPQNIPFSIDQLTTFFHRFFRQFYPRNWRLLCRYLYWHKNKQTNSVSRIFCRFVAGFKIRENIWWAHHWFGVLTIVKLTIYFCSLALIYFETVLLVEVAFFLYHTWNSFRIKGFVRCKNVKYFCQIALFSSKTATEDLEPIRCQNIHLVPK